jgi:hypothetical protein
MQTKNLASSDLTHKRQTRMQFANYIIQQQAVANGCLGRITIEGGSGGDKMATIFTDIKQGARFTTDVERIRILASDTCPTTSAPAPAPAPEPAYTSGEGIWGVGINAGTTTSGATTRASWVDNDGNIYIGGSYNNAKLSVNSYTSLSGTTITQTLFGLLPQPSSTNNSSFIIKYNSSGVVQWATNLSATVGANLYNILADTNGDVYTIHSFNGTATVNSYGNDGGSGGDMTPTAYGTIVATATDVLIVKYNSSGTVQWVAQITGFGNEQSNLAFSKNIGVDSNGNVLFTIRSLTTDPNTVQFKNFSSGGGGGSITTTDFGSILGANGSIYACKINSSGTFQWVSRIKPTDANTGSDHMSAVDSNDNLFVVFTCSFNFSLDSYSSVSSGTISTTTWGTNNAISAGARGGFVTKLNSSGTFQALSRFTTTNRLVVEPSICIDSNDNVYATFRYYASSYNAANKINIYSFSGTDPAGGAVEFTAWASLPVISTQGEAAIIKFNSSLNTQAATYMSVATAAAAGRTSQIFSIDRDSDNNIFVNVYFQSTELTIYNFSSGGGGLDTNITTTTFGTVANSGTVGFFDCAIVKFNSSLVAQWATRLNGTVNQSDLPYTISVDRTNGFVYSAGTFSTNNTDGFRLNNYGGVSGGAVTLNLFATIPSAATSSTNTTQSFLAKYKT